MNLANSAEKKRSILIVIGIGCPGLQIMLNLTCQLVLIHGTFELGMTNKNHTGGGIRSGEENRNQNTSGKSGLDRQATKKLELHHCHER